MFSDMKAHMQSVVTLILCLLALSHSQAQELVLLNWGEYLSKGVVQAFTRETGHTIRVVVYDSDPARDDILASSAIDDYDLVVIDSLSAQRFGKLQKLVNLDQQLLPNVANLRSIWRQSCGQYSTPYFWGTLGILYRSDRINFKPSSWADLLYPREELKGHVGMQLGFYDTLTPALKLMGTSLNSENSKEIKAAHGLLQRQKPHVLTYQYALSYLSESENKDNLHMALGYSGDQYVLNGEQDQGLWKYVIPKEGTAIWIDCLSVIASTTKKIAALMFIDFLNRTDIAVLNANEVGAATTHLTAKKLINKELLEDASLYPNPDAIGDSEFVKPISTTSMRQRADILRALKK